MKLSFLAIEDFWTGLQDWQVPIARQLITDALVAGLLYGLALAALAALVLWSSV